MDLFGIFVYVSMGFLLFDLVYIIFKTKYKYTNVYIVLINSFFCLIISNLSIWQEGIYVDEYNLCGNSLSFMINIVNIIIFIVMFFIVFTKINNAKNI